jgi:DNA-binding CsgD family transcriptional regulator
MLQFNDQLSTSLVSDREREVIELVAQGLSAKQIAQRLEITPRTVERHFENVRNKLRAKNQAHMVAKALTSGMIEFELQSPES